MSNGNEVPDEPTRRAFAKYGGTVALGGLLAGCTGGGAESDGSDGGASDGNSTDDGSTDGGDSEESADDAGDGSYTASISPVGEVTFESPPETVFTRLTHHADMAFALGRSDGITAMHAPDYYDALWNQYVERLPGVSLDWSGLYSSWEPDKEKLYELDSDIHLADPAWVTQVEGWDRSDIDEIAENVSPWFGNSLSDRHQPPAEEWADGYEYYGLWEQFERVAEAFQERERYEALAEVREGLLSTIEDGLPTESERPDAVLISSGDMETVYAYTLDNPGFLTSHTRPLAPNPAFGGSVESGATVDFEQLLEADPDVILFLGGMQPGTSMAEVRSTLENDPVASEVTAVQNGRVHPQGARYQGPILNLFQLEMTAKQLYPDEFGAWPTYDEGPYPEIPQEERLFDRQRVADAINGDL
ncbi:ABC-type Fe3+-hydroxamate transport system substrate-binding protein [Halorubrum trapanicum]|uniref:ABC-type Fe3+-hydroxamate transport system substrate-binding protein n=1 Tax=Halorubrum trapanicum TaxID=29284 RepID=A0A8J7R9B0_9EURY|nr:ABC transporter substrate-binding protein [Halorubrum trapanicum]MBP1901998.1 ABC-type Fe3+-hydroxamate transport system substrate-binding protein [Halorubrum trapanicum]